MVLKNKVLINVMLPFCRCYCIYKYISMNPNWVSLREYWIFILTITKHDKTKETWLIQQVKTSRYITLIKTSWQYSSNCERECYHLSPFPPHECLPLKNCGAATYICHPLALWQSSGGPKGCYANPILI